VKVEELEMLYAEFCLGTRATEEPSVTCGQRGVSRLRAQRGTGEQPHSREKPAQEGRSYTAPTPETSVSCGGDLHIYF